MEKSIILNEEFIKIIINTNSLAELKVLFYVSAISHKGVFYNNSLLLKSYNEEVGMMSRPTFFTALKSLCDSDFLTKQTKSQYSINSNILR